jgi:Patatin-like phospholipase
VTGDRFQVLVLNWGRPRGSFSARTLTALKEDPISTVDLIAGTSTGGIIALGLGLGLVCGHGISGKFWVRTGQAGVPRACPARSPLWAQWATPQNPTRVRVTAASPTRIPRMKRHYAANDGTAASMVSLALDKPLCR